MATTGPLMESEDLERLHKEANHKVVVPMMAIIGPIFVFLHYSPTPQWLAAVLLGMFTVVMNAYYVEKSPVLRLFGRSFPLRNDIGDAIRWCCNLLLADAPLMLLLRPGKVPMFGLWTLLIFSTYFDIYRRKHRIPVTALALVCSAFTLVYVHPDTTLLEVFFWSVTIICILVVFTHVEKVWLAEAQRRLRAQEQEQHTAQQAERLYRKAIIGEHARTIAHEVSNLAMGINLAIHNTSEINVPAVQRSIEYLKRLAQLVLDDVKTSPMVRLYKLSELFSDLNILMRKQVELLEISWSVVIDEELQQLAFKERAGSVYFIMQNLIRNAIDAIKHAGRGGIEGQIRVSAHLDGNSIVLIVQDNGIGMSRDQTTALLSGAGSSTKAEGHGIGMRLVYQECLRNHFQLIASSNPDVGSSIGVSIPIHGFNRSAAPTGEKEPTRSSTETDPLTQPG